MHEAIVVTGPPGAGKSTVCEHLASSLDPSALVAGDLFFAFLRNSHVDPWLNEANDQNQLVIEAAAGAAGCLARRFHVVYDGVVGPWFLRTFLDASNLGSVHYAVLLPPLSVCLERVASRANHGFTDRDAAQHMWTDFKGSIGGLQQHVLDAGEPPATVAQDIMQRVADGTLRYGRHGDRTS